MKFCDQCGRPVGSQPSQNLNAPNSSGPNLQAGRDIYYGPSTDEPTPACTTTWSWRSPVTMATLTWTSVGLGIIGILAGWKGLRSLFQFGTGAAGSGTPPTWTLVMMLFAFLAVAVVLALRKLIKTGNQWFSPISWLPSITGWGGHLGLARHEGVCTLCGGRLRFYDKPVRWNRYPNGRREVTERTMAAECTRNPDHWWHVDRTTGSW